MWLAAAEKAIIHRILSTDPTALNVVIVGAWVLRCVPVCVVNAPQVCFSLSYALLIAL